VHSSEVARRRIGLVGQASLKEAAHPSHEHPERLDEQIPLGRKVAIEYRGCRPHFLDDVGYPGAFVSLANEQPGGGRENSLACLLVLFCDQVDVRCSGGDDTRRQPFPDGPQRQALILQTGYFAQESDVMIGVDRPAGRGFLRGR
jgi:hypothetical protein